MPGTFTIRAANQSLLGVVESDAVIISGNAILTVSSASAFSGLVNVENGGRLRILNGAVSFGRNLVINAGDR